MRFRTKRKVNAVSNSIVSLTLTLCQLHDESTHPKKRDGTIATAISLRSVDCMLLGYVLFQVVFVSDFWNSLCLKKKKKRKLYITALMGKTRRVGRGLANESGRLPTQRTSMNIYFTCFYSRESATKPSHSACRKALTHSSTLPSNQPLLVSKRPRG